MTVWRSTWRVPIGLVALGAVPVTAGALRLVELSGGTTAMASDARFDATPLPVVLHIAWPPCLRSSEPSSSPRACDGAGPAGTAEPGGCWSSQGWGWRCRRCG